MQLPVHAIWSMQLPLKGRFVQAVRSDAVCRVANSCVKTFVTNVLDEIQTAKTFIMYTRTFSSVCNQ